MRLPDLPPFDPLRYAADSWEHVLYTDALQRLVYLTSYASYHSNQRQTDHALLLLALRLTEELLQPETLATVRRLNLISAQDFRAFGVIYGQYSRYVKEQERESKEEEVEAGLRMRRTWKMYLDINPGDAEIRRTYESGLNPYTGEAIFDPYE